MITKLKAITDSLIKWDYARKTGCGVGQVNAFLVDEHNHIFEYQGSCGLCERYYFSSENCVDCPFYKKKQRCHTDKENYYAKWSFSCDTKERKRYARKIYKLIYNLLTDKQKEKFTK